MKLTRGAPLPGRLPQEFTHTIPEPPQLAKMDARRWYAFWDRYPKEERQEKRGERGGDGGR